MEICTEEPLKGRNLKDKEEEEKEEMMMTKEEEELRNRSRCILLHLMFAQ
jgi:hypothetical protein